MGFLYVFLGGGLGSICRYGIAQILKTQQLNFPLATLIANIISCIILGMLVAYTLKNEWDESYKLGLMTGFCGGFSTFSTFTNETFQLFQQGNILYAFTNILLSLLICLIAIYTGMKIIG